MLLPGFHGPFEGLARRSRTGGRELTVEALFGATGPEVVPRQGVSSFQDMGTGPEVLHPTLVVGSEVSSAP